jgi:hypothetical protein
MSKLLREAVIRIYIERRNECNRKWQFSPLQAMASMAPLGDMSFLGNTPPKAEVYLQKTRERLLRYPQFNFLSAGCEVNYLIRRMGSPLATLLSLLLAATSVSASACDLSCWFHLADSDCHIAGSNASFKSRTVQSKSSVMKVKSHHCGRSIGNHTINGVPRHSASSAIAMRMHRADVVSRTSKACTQDECRQPSASMLLLVGNISRTDPLHAMDIGILNPSRLNASSHWASLENPPRGIPAPDRVTTSLRI